LRHTPPHWRSWCSPVQVSTSYCRAPSSRPPTS
jgi:hypothetical protein